MLIEKRIPMKYILHKVRWDIPLILIFSITVHWIDLYYISIKIPVAIPAFLGTAISLVLSFKLSQSYDRWWEARKIWGAIVNDCRSVIMQLQNFTKPSVKNKNTVNTMAYRQIAWSYALALSLRKLNPLHEIKRLLSEKEIKELRSQKNVPLALIRNQLIALSTLHRNKQLGEFQNIQIDSSFVRLVASMGKAERIKNTVFPRTYRIFLHLFIYIFLASLGVALTNLHSIIEIPVLLFISIPFFLLEKTAFHMQDPFENRPSDTATLAISRTIEINIRQLLKEENIPEPMQAEGFYLM